MSWPQKLQKFCTEPKTSDPHPGWLGSQERSLTKAEVFLLISVLADYTQLRNSGGVSPTFIHPYHLTAYRFTGVGTSPMLFIFKQSMGAKYLNSCQNLTPWTTDTVAYWNEWTELVLRGWQQHEISVTEYRIKPVYWRLLLNGKPSDQKAWNDATGDAGSQLWSTGHCGGEAMNTRVMPLPACLTHMRCTSKKSLQCNYRRAT